MSSALPFLISRIEAGFPSPADDYREEPLDLKAFVVTNPAATFYVRAERGSLPARGIERGDLLVVDRSRRPQPGSVGPGNRPGRNPPPVDARCG